MIAIPVAGVYKIIESVGVVIPLLVIGVGIAIWCFYRHNQKVERLAYLQEKHQDEFLVQNIMQGCFWKGQTGEQLEDSLGKPVDIEYKALKNNQAGSLEIRSSWRESIRSSHHGG